VVEGAVSRNDFSIAIVVVISIVIVIGIVIVIVIGIVIGIDAVQQYRNRRYPVRAERSLPWVPLAANLRGADSRSWVIRSRLREGRGGEFRAVEDDATDLGIVGFDLNSALEAEPEGRTAASFDVAHAVEMIGD